MKRERYEAGDVLCDMRDHFRGLPDSFEVVSHIRLKSYRARQILDGINPPHRPANKELVVVGHTPDLANIVAAYSYDGVTFGLVELRHTQPEAPESESGSLVAALSDALAEFDRSVEYILFDRGVEIGRYASVEAAKDAAQMPDNWYRVGGGGKQYLVNNVFAIVAAVKEGEV